MPNLPRPPWPVCLVVLMTIGAITYQYPHWRVPEEYQSVFLTIIVFSVSALSLGLLWGGRWAFVVDFLAVWIFPFETWKGIKPLERGTILSVTHLVAVILLAVSWRYFWSRTPQSASSDDTQR